MKKISVKLTDSEYKYLCQIIKEVQMNNDDDFQKYCMNKVIEGELNRLISKVPSLKGKGIKVSFNFAEYIIIYAVVNQRIQPNMMFYDEPNGIMIVDLLAKFNIELERMRKEEKAINDAMI